MKDSRDSPTSFLDNIEIIKTVGKGSFSNVYLCEHKHSSLRSGNKPFIVKEINLNTLVIKYLRKSRNSGVQVKTKETNYNITPYNEKIKRTTEQEYYYTRLTDLIKTEIEVLHNINHPNIVEFYNSTCNDDVFFLSMEYCDNGDLYNILKNKSSVFLKSKNKFGGLDGEVLLTFVDQMANVLSYLHSQNIIHRDIKPQNILVSRNNTFKLSDFGFACYDVSKNTFDDKMKDPLCKKYYKLCGTPYYMAPELICNMNKLENITYYDDKLKQNMTRVVFYNSNVDIWSFGICLYEVMFNAFPFSDINCVKDLEEFFKQDCSQQYIEGKIRRRNQYIPETLESILQGCLQIDSSKRLNADELLQFVTLAKRDNSVRKINESMMVSLDSGCQNDNMRHHIVRSPVTISQENEENNSWVKINNSSILFRKAKISSGFKRWMFD